MNSGSSPVTPAPPWEQVDTVFLDMDGTLLDLHFDNHFWTRFVPARYGEKHNISAEQAFETIFPHMLSIKGSLDWYNVHYWSDYLGMDVLALKRQAADRVRPRPGALAFLRALVTNGKHLVLATNAHEDTLAIKFERSGIGAFFDQIVTSHQLGVAKETVSFWQQLQSQCQFDRTRSLFIDDNEGVLRAAHRFGIAHLLTIAQPDLRQPPQAANGFTAIEDFAGLLENLET